MSMWFRDRSTLSSTQNDQYEYADDNEYYDSSEDYSDPDYEQCSVQDKAKLYMKKNQSFSIQKYGTVNAVIINMQGNRKADNKEYKKKGGVVLSVPFEIHHNPDMNATAKDCCTMIALPKTFHDSKKPHWGAACQYRAKYGKGY